MLKTIPDALEAFRILLLLKVAQKLKAGHEDVLKDAVQKLLVLKRDDGRYDAQNVC